MIWLTASTGGYVWFCSRIGLPRRLYRRRLPGGAAWREQ